MVVNVTVNVVHIGVYFVVHIFLLHLHPIFRPLVYMMNNQIPCQMDHPGPPSGDGCTWGLNGGWGGGSVGGLWSLSTGRQSRAGFICMLPFKHETTIMYQHNQTNISVTLIQLKIKLNCTWDKQCQPLQSQLTYGM
jgi:hypothetical protein